MVTSGRLRNLGPNCPLVGETWTISEQGQWVPQEQGVRAWQASGTDPEGIKPE
ncbi:MAG: hypothetical protein ACQETE_13560 [Bacteroidota bacterium]